MSLDLVNDNGMFEQLTLVVGRPNAGFHRYYLSILTSDPPKATMQAKFVAIEDIFRLLAPCNAEVQQ